MKLWVTRGLELGVVFVLIFTLGLLLGGQSLQSSTFVYPTENFSVFGSADLKAYQFSPDYRSTALPLNASASVCWVIDSTADINLLVASQYETVVEIDKSGTHLVGCFRIPSSDQWYFVIVNWDTVPVHVDFAFTIWR